MKELWLPVAGFENLYQVSNLGRVQTLKSGRIRVPFLNKGYWQLNLTKQNKPYGQRVHVLVAKAFLPKCPGEIGVSKGQWTVDHIDNDKNNNAASNLQWMRCDDNFRKNNMGVDHPCAKLTTAKVLAIKADRRNQRAIANAYGISQSSVSDIQRGVTWAECI